MSLLNILNARKIADARSSRSAAQTEMESIFRPSEWGIDIGIEEYNQQNKENLWRNELRRAIRRKMEEMGESIADYAAWLEDIHYVYIGVYRKSVFASYRENVGWRVGIISVPAAGAIAMGIASHYQGGQNHNQLGRASNLLYDAARDGLAGAAATSVLPGRKVGPDDWDRDGLILNPATTLAGVDLTSIPGIGNLILKDVRTTTVKKLIATYISIEALSATVANSEIHDKLSELNSVASTLAAVVYPFRSTDEFEPVRSLALQDLAAASLRLQLRRKSSTRSVVRIYYGPPGTGKTLAAVREAVKLADPGFDNDGGIEAAFTRFNELSGQVAFITFHPALQYEDVIESIRPLVAPQEDQGQIAGGDEDEEDRSDKVGNGELAYRIHEGLFLRMIRKASEQPDKDFVIIIDEINRGDVSRILGPLISALEPDKRVGAEFPVGVELQYPRAEDLESRLYVPPNIHFIGTMNSADRNIALVDHALRRRFDFIACPPESALLGTTTGYYPIDMRRLLQTLNERIGHVLDADHCIGHGYFMGCKTTADLIEVFARKIIPLMVEYFYGNAGLMLLVFGDIPGGEHNIFQVIEPETSFEKVFNVDREAAARLGYRAHEVSLGVRLDPRFWDPARAIPGPADEAYASTAIRKIYEPAAPAEGVEAS
jgi:5-methylcytosine-specific restriction enzyme B